MQYSTLAFDVLPVFLSLVLTIVLVYFLNLSSTGAAIAVMVGYAAGVSLSLIFIRHLFPNIKWWGVLSLSKIKELLSFSVPNSLAVMFNQWLLNVTILFLGLHVASSEIGTFQAAEQVSMLSALVLIAFSKVFSPMITDLYEKRDLGRLNELFRVSTKWGLYVCLPLLIVVIFYPSSILRLVYGVGYGTGASVLLIIMMSQIVNTATGSVSSMLSMTGHQKIFLLNAMAAFIACVVLNLVLTPLFGSIGAAVSIGGSIVVLNLLLLWSVRRNLGLWPYDRRYYKLLLALLPTVVVMFLVKEVWPAPTPWELTLAVLASYGIFALSLILLKLEDYELSLLRVTLKRFMRLPIFVNRG
jgi:O-antigen/teichoic acid export membrane protein